MNKLNTLVQRFIDSVSTQVDSIDINDAIDAPKGESNSAVDEFYNEHKALVDYAIAFALCSQFERRKKEAKEKLEELGIITAADKDLVPGDTYTIHASDYLSLECKVSQPVTKVDNKKLVTELRKAGVKSELLDKALAEATSENAPAKSYTVNMK